MNKLIIIGNLTRDPELRVTQNGVSVCRFTLAVNDRRKNQDGDVTVQYFQVSAWRQLGEACGKYLAKGKKVFVSGPVTARTYQGREGGTQVSLDVTAEDVEFLSPSGQQGTQQARPRQGDGYTPVEMDELPF